MSVMPERTVMKRAVILQRKESKAYNIGLWPKPKTRRGDNGSNKAKALLRRIDSATTKDGYSQVGIKRSGIAGRRGSSNFLFAVRAKHLLKKLGL